MKKAGLALFVIFISLFCASFVGAVTINVCSTCNYTTIQSAIDNASNGNIINVSAGSYNEDLVIPSNKDNLEIKSDDSAVIKGIANVNQINWPLAAPNIEILADGVKIHGFTIESPDYAALKYTSGIVIGGDNVEIYDNNFIINSADSTDEISQVIQTYASSVMPGVDISGLNIHDNTFSHKGSGNWGYEAIYINPDEGSGTIYFKDNEFSGKVFRAITSERSKTTIEGNRIVTDLVISADNLSSAGAYQGINIGSGGVQSNIIVKGNIVKGSDSTKGFNQGIRIGQTGQTFSNVKVENNILNYNKEGVLVKIANGVIINYNTLVGNIDNGVKNDNTNLLNAEYNYWGSCNGPGPVGPGYGDNVSANVDYTPWLGICITNKTNATCAFETKNVTLSANLTGEEIEDVWFSYTINGTNYNKTASHAGGNKYQIIIPSTYLVGGQNVTWNVYANDSIGNLYNNSWKTIYAIKKTQLVVNPINPDGLNGWYLYNPLFELIKDSLTGNSYYQWDSTGKILYTGIFSTENAPNNQNITGGIVELNWLSDFGACGNETKQNRTFFIDLTNPLISDINPKNNDIVYGLNTKISAYLEEKYQSNSGINESSIVMKINNTQVYPNIILVNSSKLDFNISYIPNLSEGWNNVSVYVEDLAGRNSSLTWSFFVISTGAKFNLSVYSPKDLIYNNKRVQFNISTIEKVKNIEYINYNDSDILCRECDEYGFSRKKLKSLNEGENRIIIRATDNIGNQQNKSVSLIVETKEPLILKTYPRANSYTNGSEFYIKYTEDNLNKTELFWNGSKELNCSKGSNQECATSANLSSHNGEQIEYWFKITDIINNTKESKKTKIKVDTKSPVINSIEYNIDFNRKKIELKINATEDNLDKIQYRDLNQSNSKFNTLCRKLKEGICEKTVSFKGDIPNIQILALDKAGNSDVELTP